MSGFLIIPFAAIGILVVFTLTINPFLELPFGYAHDVRELYKPTGVEAKTTILSNADGCLFEVNDTRHVSNIGLFVEDACLYLPGEEVIVYETQGAGWKVKGLVSEVES